MKRRPFFMLLVAMLAIVASRPAAALWLGIGRDVTPANAKQHGISIQVAKGKGENSEPVLHFKIVRKIDRESRPKPFVADLAVRKAGKLVARSTVTPVEDENERSWCFSISANYLDDSTFDINEILPPYGDGATCVHYKIKLKDFVAPEEPGSGPRATDTAGPPAADSDVVFKPVTPDNAAANDLSFKAVEETLGKFSGEKAGPIVRYTIFRTGDQAQKAAEQIATLTVRSGGKPVASCEVPIYTWCGGVPWYFDLSPDCVAESVFAIEAPLSKDNGQNCTIRLSDFPVERKSQAEKEEEE